MEGILVHWEMTQLLVPVESIHRLERLSALLAHLDIIALLSQKLQHLALSIKRIPTQARMQLEIVLVVRLAIGHLKAQVFVNHVQLVMPALQVLLYCVLLVLIQLKEKAPAVLVKKDTCVIEEQQSELHLKTYAQKDHIVKLLVEQLFNTNVLKAHMELEKEQLIHPIVSHVHLDLYVEKEQMILLSILVLKEITVQQELHHQHNVLQELITQILEG